MKEFLKKVSWVTIANAVSMVVSALITIILPKCISETEYGYWQMYLLFVTYIGCIHLGLPDGIYLRYSGKEFREVISSEIRILFWLSSLCEILIGLVIWFLFKNSSIHELALCFALCTCVYVPSLYLKYVMLASNLMKQYSIYILSEKMVYILAIVYGLYISSSLLDKFIYVDLVGKSIALIYASYVCKEVFCLRHIPIVRIWDEYKSNIFAGICLMISTVSSNFIVGVIRIFIDIQWSIEDFGKVSLALQISNFILAFVRAVSLPLFPTIKKQEVKKAAVMYDNLRLSLITIIFVFFCGYYPLAEFLRVWLSDYSTSIYYLGILFPICLFESKQALVCETYLKSFRKERFLLLINVGTMLISIVVSGVLIFGLKTQIGAIVFILFILGFRNTVSEVYLERYMNKKMIKKIIFELVVVLIFILSNITLRPITAACIYIISFVAYVFSNKRGYKQLLHFYKEER